MGITKIEQVGQAAKITYLDTSVLYTWKDGRHLVSPDNENIVSTNFKLTPEDDRYTLTYLFSEQTEKYGTSDAIGFVEYLILNDIFFSDGVVETKTAPEAIKIDETVTDTTFIGFAKAGSLESAAVWKCQKIDETVTNAAKITWADGAKYTQVATDLTSLTYS